MILFIVLTISVIFFLLFAISFFRNEEHTGDVFETSERKAGKRGEKIATVRIRHVLNDGDLLLTNVLIENDGKKTELDNVIVNDCGVFAIEVKNYVGRLSGGENDFEWEKIKVTPGGETYRRTVKNPIRQVKRQEYILGHYLRSNGVNVWVEGYAFLINNNSPIDSPKVLSDDNDIDKALHPQKGRRLNVNDQKAITSLLTKVI